MDNIEWGTPIRQTEMEGMENIIIIGFPSIAPVEWLSLLLTNTRHWKGNFWSALKFQLFGSA